jgi:hypothetical protein
VRSDREASSSFKSTRKEQVDYDIDVKLKEGDKPSLILYKYRWVVLFAYFLTSTSTGALTGSLSTNRAIINKISPDIGEG